MEDSFFIKVPEAAKKSLAACVIFDSLRLLTAEPENKVCNVETYYHIAGMRGIITGASWCVSETAGLDSDKNECLVQMCICRFLVGNIWSLLMVLTQSESGCLSPVTGLPYMGWCVLGHIWPAHQLPNL